MRKNSLNIQSGEECGRGRDLSRHSQQSGNENQTYVDSDEEAAGRSRTEQQLKQSARGDLLTFRLQIFIRHIYCHDQVPLAS